MYVCYIDEAGCTGELPNATSPIQPIFVLAAIIIRQDRVKDFTIDFLRLKQRFFPNRLPGRANFLDWMPIEIKGATLREHVRGTSRNRRRHALGFMDYLLRLLEQHDVRIIGKLFVKGIGQPFNGTAVYTSSVQTLCDFFQGFLTSVNDTGIVILDSRNKPKNTNVSHSVFTQKFRSTGDRYGRIGEMPVFGHSDNHAGVQAADLVCSAYLFPMAAHAYCFGHVHSIHVHQQYERIRRMFGSRLKHLQFRYQDTSGWWRGGITVSDGIARKKGSELFS